MLARPQRLTSARSFALTRKEGRIYHDRLLTLTSRLSGEPLTRIGYVVSRRVGGAVVRNTVKRRLRMATRALLPHLQPGYDIVVVARPALASASFVHLSGALRGTLHRARVLTPMVQASTTSRPEVP